MLNAKEVQEQIVIESPDQSLAGSEDFIGYHIKLRHCLLMSRLIELGLVGDYNKLKAENYSLVGGIGFIESQGDSEEIPLKEKLNLIFSGCRRHSYHTYIHQILNPGKAYIGGLWGDIGGEIENYSESKGGYYYMVMDGVYDGVISYVDGINLFYNYFKAYEIYVEHYLGGPVNVPIEGYCEPLEKKKFESDHKKKILKDKSGLFDESHYFITLDDQELRVVFEEEQKKGHMKQLQNIYDRYERASVGNEREDIWKEFKKFRELYPCWSWLDDFASQIVYYFGELVELTPERLEEYKEKRYGMSVYEHFKWKFSKLEELYQGLVDRGEIVEVQQPNLVNSAR